MLRSRKIFCVIRCSLILVCVRLVLSGETKSDPGEVHCTAESGQCDTESVVAPVQKLSQLTEPRGKRSVSEEEFWKRIVPLLQSRYKSGPRSSLSPDDVIASYFRASVKDKGDAFWKRVDPHGFWRRSALEADDEDDTRKADEGQRNMEVDRFQGGKRVDRLLKDDIAVPEDRMTGNTNKERRRQDALTRPEFNPTGW